MRTSLPFFLSGSSESPTPASAEGASVLSISFILYDEMGEAFLIGLNLIFYILLESQSPPQRPFGFICRWLVIGGFVGEGCLAFLLFFPLNLFTVIICIGRVFIYIVYVYTNRIRVE